MHTDIVQDLTVVTMHYTELERLKEVIFVGASTDADNFCDEGTQPNEAINNGAVIIVPKAIN
eukprot:13421110-Ditylum_brightwellii.AAC.1